MNKIVVVDVYNDNKKVFSGNINDWFKENDNDEYLIDLCKEITEGKVDEVTFFVFSGDWKVTCKVE